MSIGEKIYYVTLFLSSGLILFILVVELIKRLINK